MSSANQNQGDQACDVWIEKRVAELAPWFQNLNLGGVQTAPEHFLGNYPQIKWERFSHVLPESMEGWSVLDIGCNAGFYALEMKRRGASRVVGLDTDERYLAQARLAAEVTGLELELRQLSVYDVQQLGERFDLVLFMGVLYHLRHPLLALDLVRRHACCDLMVFQSMQRGCGDGFLPEPDYDFWNQRIFEDPDFPRMHFVEASYAEDPTNWWIPNASCVQALLRSAGFEIVSRPEQEVYLCRVREPWEVEGYG